MKKILLTLLLCFCMVQTHAAEDEVTTNNRNAVIDQLFDVTHMPDMSAQISAQTQAMIERDFANMPAQYAILAEQYLNKIRGLVADTLKWENMQDKYASLYEKTFTEKEMQTLIEFYQSDVGRAFLKKTPKLMEDIIQLSQKEVENIMPEIHAIKQDLIDEIEARKKGRTLNKAP